MAISYRDAHKNSEEEKHRIGKPEKQRNLTEKIEHQ